MSSHPTTSEIIKTQWFRQVIKLILDGQMGLVAWLVMSELTQDSAFSASTVAIWCLIVMSASAMFRNTHQHYRMAGFKDLVSTMLAALVAFLVAAGATASGMSLSPNRGYLFLFMASLFTGMLWTSIRLITRAIYEGEIPFFSSVLSRPSPVARALIVGAGRAGFLVAEELKRHQELGAVVVGFVDDAFEKQGLRIQGIPVLGTTELIPMIIQENQISQVIMAIPSAPGQVVRHIRNVVRATGVELKTVPGFYNLLGNQPWQPEIRNVSIEDLLRRDPIHLDQTALGRILHDAVVLITGGGGSIGSELARQVATYSPARIVLLGRGEYSLWLIERELRATFPSLPLSIELCDIRQKERLHQAFLRWKPGVVFHTAAHKHLPFLELYPEEAIENNIFGTRQVLDAALGVGTRIFVNVSTDKSVNPTNVLGVSKFLAETIVRAGADHAAPGTKLVSVRFGNVLGSRGSVVPIFREQILRGGPLTVTDPKMTRYFMTVPEASQLVLQAGLLGETGKVYVLDMGDPVRILDLAKDMITLSGLDPELDIEIKFTGIRPGEKLFEELFHTRETRQSCVHPKVFEALQESSAQTTVEGWLQALRQTLAIEDETLRRREILHLFRRLVPSYVPAANGLGGFSEAPEILELPRVAG
jgi:FlaA1/EpsC-like NDP-sugar epimerase